MTGTELVKNTAVLLVEDSAAAALRIKGFLDEAKGPNFILYHVPNLASALSRLDQGGIDVVLLDLGLPDSEGLDTFSKVRAHAPDLPTVVLTGVSDEEKALEALRQGAQDYLFKGDVDGKTVVRAIRYAIERRQAEERLRESEEKHRTLLEVLPEIIYRVDADGNFTYLNNSIERLGYTPQELIGKHFSFVVHPEDLKNVSREYVLPNYLGKRTGEKGAPKLLDERRRGNRMTKDLVLRLVPKGWKETGDSEFLIGLITSYGEVSAVGQYSTESYSRKRVFVGTVGIIKDITDRKRAEEAKAALQDQLQRSQKMEAIGRLAGGVAHDMNNILGAILGSASVLDVEIDPQDPKREDLKNIIMACRKGRDLTQDLLGFARKGKYVKENLSLNDIAVDAKSLLSRTFTKKIHIELNLSEDLYSIEGDRNQIHHAVMNVCINGADAMKNGGILSISTENIYLDSAAAKALGTLEPGKYVMLKIRDTGVGMEEETLKNAFEPFFTTKPEGEGTGLGLSMVYGVLENHGGKVMLTSKPGRGTTVTFFLPALDHYEMRPVLPPSDNPVASSESGGVLLIDDEQTIRSSAKRLLERLGYQVYLAEDGNSGLEVYKNNKSVISLVILDLIMPDMDGHETFEKLVAFDPDVKVLLLSGYSKDEKVEKLLARGALGFAQKPFDIKTLSQILRKTLHGGT
jgi:PAS domain S-box-containing protein